MPIIQKTVSIIITNQGRHYEALGYERLKQGTTLTVPVEHLPKNSMTKIDCKCDRCGENFSRHYQNINKMSSRKRIDDGQIYCRDCTQVILGPVRDQTKAAEIHKQNIGPKHHRWNTETPAVKRYRSNVIQLTKQTYKKFKHLINPDDLPRKIAGTDGGWQLDHIVSIKEGWERGIDPSEIATPENLKCCRGE